MSTEQMKQQMQVSPDRKNGQRESSPISFYGCE
jgi:hypothetical protein